MFSFASTYADVHDHDGVRRALDEGAEHRLALREPFHGAKRHQAISEPVPHSPEEHDGVLVVVTWRAAMLESEGPRFVLFRVERNRHLRCDVVIPERGADRTVRRHCSGVVADGAIDRQDPVDHTPQVVVYRSLGPRADARPLRARVLHGAPDGRCRTQDRVKHPGAITLKDVQHLAQHVVEHLVDRLGAHNVGVDAIECFERVHGVIWNRGTGHLTWAVILPLRGEHSPGSASANSVATCENPVSQRDLEMV